MIVTLNGTVSGTNSENVIFPTNSSLHGVPYNEWLVKWWVWRSGIPNDMHPEVNYTNPDVKKCSAMQDGPVWFLPAVSPGKGEIHYKCEVPAGKEVMLVLTSTSCDIGIEGKITDQELKDCAFNIQTPLSNMEVLVDGKKVNSGLLGDQIQTDYYNVTYPSNPITVWGPVQPGTYRAIAEGYFLFLHGLAPGKHIIETNVIDLLKGKMTPELPANGVYEIFVQ